MPLYKMSSNNTHTPSPSPSPPHPITGNPLAIKQTTSLIDPYRQRHHRGHG